MKNRPRWARRSEQQLMQHEGAELFRAPAGETHLEQVSLLSIALFGLMCHVLMFWLLSFPYTSSYNPYLDDVPSLTTGWQALGFLLIFPVFPYLACLLPMVRKSAERKKRLEAYLYLNSLVNLGGFLLIYGILQLPRMEDPLHFEFRLDAAYEVHLILLFLAVLASSISSVLLGSLLWRSRTLR